MNPWTLIGWIVAIFLLISLSPLILALLKIPVALAADLRDQRTLRRAHRGRLGCQHREADRLGGETSCYNVATRRTPNGFYCEDHFNDRRNAERRTFSGSVSYAFVLDWYKDEFERRRLES